MGSGSSAATDLVAEFKDCKNEFRSHEYIFLHCPNGVFDLEDKLLYNNNALRSDEALRTFAKQMDDLYDKRFWWVGDYKTKAGVDFKKHSDAFLQDITGFEYSGYWYMSEYPDTKMIAKLIAIKPCKILFHKFHKFKKITRYDNQMNITFIKPEDFYKAAKQYIYNVLGMMSGGEGNLLLDQLLLPFNLYRMDHYFDDDAFAIVVERDPRDVFILNKYIWGKKDISIAIPTDVHMFCKYYRQMRESEHPCSSKKVLRLHFEDMIYNYDATLANIKEFLQFTDEDHIHPKERFDPALSIRNTQLFHENKYQKERRVIEQELKDYLYDFPYEINNNVDKTVEFD